MQEPMRFDVTAVPPYLISTQGKDVEMCWQWACSVLLCKWGHYVFFCCVVN